jgi:hypothetical protein
MSAALRIKAHIYADEMATYALSKPLRRPVKFVADRVESLPPTSTPGIIAARAR